MPGEMGHCALYSDRMTAVVRVWVVDLDSAHPDTAVCTPEERERRARPGWLASRAVLRTVLGEVLGSDPRALVFGEEGRGKPVLPGIQFNLSHSGSLVAVAVADRPVGIDIETERRILRPDRLARRLCGPGYAGELDDDPRALLQCWTRAEALLKATGEGISGGLSGAERRLRAEGWDVRDLAVDQRAVGAVAAWGTDWTLRRS